MSDMPFTSKTVLTQRAGSSQMIEQADNFQPDGQTDSNPASDTPTNPVRDKFTLGVAIGYFPAGAATNQALGNCAAKICGAADVKVYTRRPYPKEDHGFTGSAYTRLGFDFGMDRDTISIPYWSVGASVMYDTPNLDFESVPVRPSFEAGLGINPLIGLTALPGFVPAYAVFEGDLNAGIIIHDRVGIRAGINPLGLALLSAQTLDEEQKKSGLGTYMFLNPFIRTEYTF